MKPSTATKILIGIGFLAAIIIPLYWILWFTAPGLIQTFPPSSPEHAAYVTFEQAFILADSWLALAALCGAIGLLRKRRWGLLFILLASSSAIFLGLMDLLYDLQHSVFAPLTPEAATELVIVILSLSLGLTGILLGWRLINAPLGDNA